MAKSKKSKILAMALCASVMTGIYASPVMAEDLSVTLDGQGIVVVGTDVTGNFTIAGADIATALNGTELTLNSVTANTISNTGNNFFVGADGKVSAISVTTTGDVVAGTYSLKDIGVRTQNMIATEGNTTAFTGNVSATGTLTAGDTTLANTTVGGTLTAGATTVDSLTVNGEATFTDKVTVQNGLTVTGGASVDGDFAVTNGGLKVAKGIEAANGTFKLTEEGKLTVGGEATFTDKVTVQNGLSVTGDTSVAGNFAVTNGGLSVTGGESVLNGGLTVNGDTLLNGKLDVGGGNFKVDTDGNTEVNGDLNIGHDAFEVTAADGSFSAARDKFNVFADGSFNAASENFKVSADGVINADSLYLQTYGGGTLEVGEALQALTDAKLPDKVGGIERDPASAADPGDGTTTIEGATSFDATGMSIKGADGFGTSLDVDGMEITATGGLSTSFTAGGATFVGAEGDQTIIEGGAITAKSLMLDGKDVGRTIAGIEGDPENEVTTIEGATSFDSDGMSIKGADGFGTSLGVDSMEITAAGGLSTRFTAGGATFVGASGTTNINGGAIQTTTINGVNFTEWHDKVDDRLDDLEGKTQNIKPGTGAGTGTGEGGTAAGEGNNIIDVPATEDGHTGINGNVTVGGEINAGEIVVGDKGSDNKTTIDGGNITTGDTTIDGDGIKTGNGNFTGNVDVDGIVTVGDDTTITGEGITTGNGTFTGDVDITGDITAGTGTIGNVDMDNTGITVGVGTTITEDTVTTENIKADNGEFDSQVTVGDNTTITDGNINLGGDNGTNINADGMIVGNANGVNTNVSAGDVVITDKEGKDIALSDVGYVENIDRELQANGNYDGTVVGGINAEADIRRAEVNRLDNRISKVEDRVDKVGAMSAAIANLRTMGYDPAAPTEIAVGVGQYRSETGVALGMFHYPNKDFMLSLSVSTSGDEVMGGIGATWKFGRKSPEKVLAAEKEKAAKAKLAKAEAMKKAAKEAKIKAQQERHAKLAAERAAQAEAAK